MSKIRLLQHADLMRHIVQSGFDTQDFIITGSSGLLVTGLIKEVHDIDIVARPGSETWQTAQELGFEHAALFGHEPLMVSRYTGDKIVKLYGGAVEVCDTWVLPGCKTGELIDAADTIDGFKYLAIEDIISYKRHLNRPKDFYDLAIIEHKIDKTSGPVSARG